MIKYTREDILRMPVSGQGSKAGLRQVAAELGIKTVEENGEIISAYSAKKPTLQEVLLALIEDSSNEDAPEVEALDNLAQRYWKQIKEYALGLYKADRLGDDPYYHAEDGGLANIALSFVMDLRMRPSDKSPTGLIQESTIKNLKSLLKTDIYTLMTTDQDIRLQAHLPHVKYIADKLFGYLEDTQTGRRYQMGLIDQALSQLNYRKKVKEKAAVEKRKEQPRFVRVSQLYEWALSILANYDGKNFKDVALALMLVTGRRPGEILATAKFAPTQKPNWVSFEGQLKTKGRSDAQLVTDIPVLAPVDQIIGALDYLGTEGKRVPESDLSQEARAAIANRTWASDINYYAKSVDSRHLVHVPDTEADGSPKKPKLTCNACRDIYSQVTLKLFSDGSQNLYQLGKFLGHRLADSATTERYDLDYKVLETEEELRALFNLAQT